MALQHVLLYIIAIIILCFAFNVTANPYGGYGGQQTRPPHPNPGNVKTEDGDDDPWVWVPPSASNPHQNAFFHIVYPATDFSYTANGGSRGWPALFKECGGAHQSPINIHTQRAPTKPMQLLKFKHYWDNENEAHMNNSGKRVDIALEGKLRKPTLRGGPLVGTYEFVELHFHWGKNNEIGSEHTINQRAYPMEAHLVHFKKSYGNVKEATKHHDGIAVVAFFFQVNAEKISDFSEIVADLTRIRRAESTVKLSSAHSAFHWIKNRTRGPYYTYTGSLTTPPCSEVVTWIIYKVPITISIRQMEEFRKLSTPDGKKIHNNHRVTQSYPHPNITHVL